MTLYPTDYGSDPLHPQATDFRVIDKDEQVGKGVITYRAFATGDLVARMAGEIIDTIQQHTLQIAPNRHLYDRYFAGYLSHSCDPNVWLDMNKLLIWAIKPIAPNTFLTMDYAQTEDYLYKQFACHCGATSCRGWVAGRLDAVRQTVTVARQRYRRI